MNTSGSTQWGVQLINEPIIYGPVPAAVMARPSYPALGGGGGAGGHGATAGWWSPGTFVDASPTPVSPDPFYIFMGCFGTTSSFSFSLCQVYLRDTNSATGTTYHDPATQVTFNGPNASNRCSPFSFNFGFTTLNPENMTLNP